MTENTQAQQQKVNDLEVHDLKIVGKNINCFRAGEWASIIGVKMVTPAGLYPRLAYKCLFEDGFIDYVPVLDSNHYTIEAR